MSAVTPSEYEVILIVPDLHIPFHNKRLVQMCLNWGFEMGVDRIVLIGDVIDAYNISRFDKNPHRKVTLQREVDEARTWLEDLRTMFPDIPIHYLEGNHEDRLRKFLWGKSRELADMRGLTIPQLLDLKGLNIQWHGSLDPLKLQGVTIMHGNRIRKQGGMTALAISDEREESIVCGHSHRQGISFRNSAAGSRFACEVGCLCDPSELDYIDSVPNWQYGWGVLYAHKGGVAQPTLATIPNPKTRNPSVIIGGTLYSGKELRV